MKAAVEMMDDRAPRAQRRARHSRRHRQMRFVAIWLALAALLVVGGIIVPRSLLPCNIPRGHPARRVPAIAAIGEALVLMSRGIDLSIPAIITLSSTMLLGFSGGRDEDIVVAIVAGIARRCRDRPDQRHAGRHPEAQRADRHACGRRDH